MPAFDQTGPQGMGPMSGRGFGPCGKGKRFGMGMGFGRCGRIGKGLGRYFGWNVPQSKEEKLEDMENYKKALQEEMEDVDKQLMSLQKQE